MIRRVAALVAALAIVAPAAAAAATARVDLGGAAGYVRPDAGVALAGLELFVRAGLDRQTASQNGLAALVAESVLLTPVEGLPLGDAVEARGGSLTYAMAGQYVRFYLEAQPEALGPLAALVARALAQPAFDAPVLGAARVTLTKRIVENDTDPRLVGLQMLRGSYYRDGAGMPPYGTGASLAGLSPADARAFYTRWYLRGDAFVTAVGQTSGAAEAAARIIAGGLPAGSAPATTVATRPFTAQPKRIVTRRDISSSYVVIGFAAPPLGDRDFPAALVMRALLGDVFEASGGVTVSNLFRPAGTIYGYDTTPAQLAVWLNGRIVDPSVGLGALDAILKSAAVKPLGAAVLARYRDSARGAWALENLSLDERAWSIGNAVAHGLDADAADAVGAAIARVTPADLQRVAKRYFQHFDVALVLPRQGSGG